MQTTPGQVVFCRDRQWVVLPSTHRDLVRLRPLSGSESQVCGVYLPLEEGAIAEAKFPMPGVKELGDHEASQLLFEAARLSLRSAAGPLRCLGRLSVRPRPYQLVPLLMALRLETIRLLIADDVGIGKTIEAGLILREMIDRGEIRRSAILCPPQLCDQWQRELKEKFHIDAVVIRSGTVAKLERQIPNGSHIFSYFSHTIISLDYAKGDRRRASFIAHCPDLVIVDEAHTCSNGGKSQGNYQQRHQLLQEIAQKTNQHLVLLTATPHNGIEASFLSLLGLLKPQFELLPLDTLNEQQRIELAQHFVQRRRQDVTQWMDTDTPFPDRNSLEAVYQLSKDYNALFSDVYDFARGLVTDVENLSYAQKRGRYWSALAIIRCVMSSPAAAVLTLSKQLLKNTETVGLEDLDDEWVVSHVYDNTDQEKSVDSLPIAVIEQGKQSFSDREKRQLRQFIQGAEALRGQKDHKLQTTIKLVTDWLKAGHHPIIWCRYIATANYVTAELRQQFEKKGKSLRVIGITGEQSEDEREIRLEELKSFSQRILVATDCLSEGVNLQTHFTTVLHYDLPWNPNRLEQREGRVDRYGQTAQTVDCILLYGDNNPMDGAVLDVLLRKAVKIHRTLGITVPIPMDSTSIQTAIFQSLFERVKQAQTVQLNIFDLLTDNNQPLVEIEKNWDRSVEREKLNRSRFAQRAIKPEEVQQELEESDRILGSEADVEQFVITACARHHCSLVKQKQGWSLPHIPPFLQPTLGDRPRLITFTTPAPDGVEYVGRNHPLVEGLAQHLLETALDEHQTAIAARCGFIVTDQVQKPTNLLLLRSRYLLKDKTKTELLAEECLIRAFTGSFDNPQWLSPEATQQLWATTKPTKDYPLARQQITLEQKLTAFPDLEPALMEIAVEQAKQLEVSHRRVRQITKEGRVTVKAQLPMDILGFYIFQPQ
ncbi:helicase-related protein [Synechocystis salina]|uniref:DEAD/DEAH box helicase n=1 Tax=Synechocystis salina LEGE 00031 TaxID=1828736 RepID=A0ABR9VVK2_9SYNC|nr:helicase-related protein [Synechocystis salina]MBE9242249.1 DEAD/DEAH box helicase [Synechocystis salina LEGE 00041]MBE9254483.1 DEAD/DEAH box helicase [Synechocystis salina LEGE 00031]